MKKKQGYALGSLLLGAASWLCLLGLRRSEKRMTKKPEKIKKTTPRKLFRGVVFFIPLLFRFPGPAYAFRIFRCNRMRSAIMAMNSLLVGFPFVLETVYPK